MLVALASIFIGSALDATGILGARETLASGADSRENISGANPKVRQSGGSIDDVEYVGRRPGEYGYTRFRRVDARATAKCRALQVVSYLWCPSGSSSRDSSEEWKNADVRGDRLPERAPARLVAGAGSSDAGFDRTVIRGPVSENISGAGSEARRVYGFSSSASGGIVSSVRHTGAQAGVSRVAGAESSDAGFDRTVIRGPVAEVARAGGNTPAASDYRAAGVTGSTLGRNPTGRGSNPRQPTCRQNRRGLRFYYAALENWRLKMERELSARSRGTPAVDGQRASGLRVVPGSRVSRSCNWIRRAVQLVRSRAQKARRSYQAWHAAQWVLREQRTWRAAVEHVQRAFPGTLRWLLSCSGAEGGHGLWKRYGGGSYYPGYEFTDAVGNWLQYRWSTFKGHYRNALSNLLSRGYRVPAELRDSGNVRAWLSPLATALAGGWARWSGNDNSHWSASWGRGC